jgi:ABC-type proline/glycine betaine transport system permease subunit
MTTPSAKQVTDYELATSYRRVVARLIDLGVGFFVLLMISGMIAELIRMLFKLDQDTFTTLFMVIWFLLLGWELTAFWLVLAYAFCLTIIGMPIGFWMFDKSPGLLTLRKR